MSVRLAAIVVLAALAGTGCRSLGLSPGPRLEPIASAPPLAVTQLVERHNQNAERVHSLEATPTVTDRKIGAAHGMMAWVRPLDFRLSLSTSMGHRLADLGSNGQDYWFWTSKAKEKEYYVGHYDDHGEVVPGLIFQPDWIVEAMGLRMISEDEAKQITIEKGDSANTTVLVHHRPGPDGTIRLKKTIVDRQTGEVREHVFYAPDNQTILARAIPSDYRALTVPAPDGPAGLTASLPNRIKIITSPPDHEPIAMEIVVGGAKVNQFAPERRVALFKVPDFDKQGFARVDIDERMSRALGEMGSPDSGSTTIRETRPAPPLNTRVQLHAPEPIGLDRESRRPVDPAPLAADLPVPGGIDAVVGARIPRPAPDAMTR